MAPLIDVPGFRIGHWTDANARTGCTVLRFDRQALAACDVRGAAPGSRELATLAPGRSAPHPDAILLTGGSAFGLAAADGVVRWLRERDRGFPTPAGPVPIVPGAVIFDLLVGEPVAPDSDAGYHAIQTARELPNVETGSVGAGTGATYGNIRRSTPAQRGGLSISQVPLAEGATEGIMTALVVLNAFGDAVAPGSDDPRIPYLAHAEDLPIGESTTLMACVTDIPLDHDALINITVAMHDGLARKIYPAHTMVDGDIAFAVTLSEGSSPNRARRMQAAIAAELAVETAIRILTAPR